MRFEFECSPSALSNLFDTTFIRPGMSREVPGGATIQLQEFSLQQRDAPTIHASLITVLVYCGGTVLSSVALGVLSNWIYDRLTRGRKERTLIRVNGLLIEVTRESITRLVVESIEIEIEK